MSVGHIYHYFANKEEIVEAIAEQELDEVLEVYASLRNREDILRSLIDHVVETAVYFSCPDNARLRLEILAEGARNPRIAGIVRTFDRRRREGAIRLLRMAHAGRKEEVDVAELTLQYEMISALISGFLSRGIRGVDVNEEVLRRGLKQAFSHILALSPEP